MLTTLLLGAASVASTAIGAICFASAGAASERPSFWVIDSFAAQIAGSAFLFAALVLAALTGVSL